MGDSHNVEVPAGVIETEGTALPTAGSVEVGHHGMMARLQELLHKVQGRGADEVSGGVVTHQVDAVAPTTDKGEDLLRTFSGTQPDSEGEFEPSPGNLEAYLRQREVDMARELNDGVVRKNSRAAVIMGKVANFAKRIRNVVLKVMAVSGV